MISINQFKELEIIVAQIKEVKVHPNADKLYVIKVDTGTAEKQLIAGIRPVYTKEELIGRQVIMINNLEPAVIRGEESQGMILAAGGPENITLLKPEKDVALGSRVK